MHVRQAAAHIVMVQGVTALQLMSSVRAQMRLAGCSHKTQVIPHFYMRSAHLRVKGRLLQVVHTAVLRQALMLAQRLQQVGPLCRAAPAQVKRFEYCWSGQTHRRLHQQQLCVEWQGWLDILHYLPSVANDAIALKRGPAVLAQVLNTMRQAHDVKQGLSAPS